MVTWFDGHVEQTKNPNVQGHVWFSISQGNNQVGIKNAWYGFVKPVLYFVESAAALNEFLHFCLNLL